jgi:hypothetical protein
MKKFVEKLVHLEREMAAEKGDFTLFALFLLEDAPNVWDLVVAAPWVDKDKQKALRYVGKRLQARLQPRELMLLSRIVLLEGDTPGLEEVLQASQVKHGLRELRDQEFFGLQIKRAYIITSQMREAALPA